MTDQVTATFRAIIIKQNNIIDLSLTDPPLFQVWSGSDRMGLKLDCSNMKYSFYFDHLFYLKFDGNFKNY